MKKGAGTGVCLVLWVGSAQKSDGGDPSCPTLPTNPTALWTSRYCVTIAQRTRQFADPSGVWVLPETLFG